MKKADESCKKFDTECKDKVIKECMNGKGVLVEKKHFEFALKKAKPSVTADMIQFYQSWVEKARQQLPRANLKPSTFT
jgi:transitional endoplasmic reticulum ATPase